MFTGVYISFLVSAKNIGCGYSLEPPQQGGSIEYPQSMFWAEICKISEDLSETFSFCGEIFNIYLNRRVFVMLCKAFQYICNEERAVTQRIHKTSHLRRRNVMTLMRRCTNVICPQRRWHFWSRPLSLRAQYCLYRIPVLGKKKKNSGRVLFATVTLLRHTTLNAFFLPT